MLSLPVLDTTDPLFKARAAMLPLRALLEQGRPLAISWSGGKDSSAALNIALVAAATLRAEGRALPPIILTHGDTGIENPEIAGYVRAELQKVAAFATAHDLDVRIHVASPSLSQSWAFRTIGQGKLPTFPGDPRECSVEFKIKPQTRMLKRVMEALREATPDGMGEPVVVIGTRFSESAGREARMQGRGERADAVWQGAFGFDYLSPIADWNINDVWDYLRFNGEFAGYWDPHQWHTLDEGFYGPNARWTAYSDFVETNRIYAAATGSTCGGVGDIGTAAVKRAEACGARFGCHLCTAVGRDRSLENMIASDQRYAYMQGLNTLQQWLIATRWDWSTRSWLGRSIDAHGYQRIQPDTYGPAMVEALLRYCLTLDIEEAEAADQLGVAPRFQLIAPEMLVAIDAEWSRYGTHRPFHALQIYRDIRDGARYHVPVVAEVPRTPRPAPRYLHVGRDWDEGNEWEFTGLRSVWEMFEECPGSGTVALHNGRTVLDVPIAEQFEVDAESATLILAFEAEDLVRRYHDNPLSGPTRAYEYYLLLGALSMRPHARMKTDEILRRTNWRARHGLAEANVDIAALIARSMSAAEYRRAVGGAVLDEAAGQAAGEGESGREAAPVPALALAGLDGLDGLDGLSGGVPSAQLALFG